MAPTGSGLPSPRWLLEASWAAMVVYTAVEDVEVAVVAKAAAVMTSMQ